MPSHAWSLTIALCASQAALAAPVPPPRPVTAESVLKPLSGTTHELAVKLVSGPFVAGVTKAPTAASLACLAGEKDPAAWLAARLKATVDADRGTVTLRLVDCPRKDAVALLSAAVEAYKGEALGLTHSATEMRYKEALVAQVLIRQQAQVRLVAQAQAAQLANVRLVVANRLVEMEATSVGPAKADVDRSVIQAPRILPTPVFGKGAPGQ